MSEDISPSHDEFFKNMMGRVAIAREYIMKYTVDRSRPKFG
jgi:hypothetical protein